MVKSGYKQTEIGVIPEEWDIKHIGEFTDATAGGTPSTSRPEYWNGNILWMSSGELNNRRIYDVVGRITQIGYNNSSTHLIPEMCVLIGLAGQGKTRGTVAINYVKLCTNQSTAAIFPSKNHNSEYLYQNLRNRYEELRDLSSGDGGRGGLNLRIIKSLPCAFPSLSEQKCIAEALSDADSMIFSLEKLIAKKKAVKQGAMQELLTGKKRLPGFTGDWSGYRIGKMGDFYSGLSCKSKKDFDCGEAHFITFLNVLSNIKVDTSILARVNVKANESQNVVQKGDLFFNTSSETPEEVGMCAVLDEDLQDTYLNSFCFGFRLLDNTHNPLFLSYYLNSSIGRKIMSILAQGATRYNLSKNNFADTIVLLPSKEEQTAIASILSDMDNEIEALEQKLAKTRQLKQGMMQQLLTGKIRLVTEEKATATIPVTEKTDLPHSRSGHNQQFDDAVMIAAIVNSFYSEKYPLGRKKVQKLLYLLRRKQEADTSEFKKKAAGPYADEIRYKGGEPIAKKNGYISTTITKKGTSFSKGKKIDAALSYVKKWKIQSDIDWLVSNFKYIGVNDLELYATIDMAICDLQHEGIAVSVDSVKDLIRSNEEWKAKLTKTYFSDADIARAIVVCKRLYS